MVEKRLKLSLWARNLEDADKKIQLMGAAYYGNVSYKVTRHVCDAEIAEESAWTTKDQVLTGFNVYAELISD